MGREEFERKYESDFEGDFAKYPDGEYVNEALQELWKQHGGD